LEEEKMSVMKAKEIMEVIPHRQPMLLIDTIEELTPGEHGIGKKCVSYNEPYFAGHFPQEPVMPGVLIVEAMAQCCGMLVLRSIPDPEHYSTYFMKIDGVKFKRKVVPGDTLHFEVQLLEPIRRGVAVVEGKAFVGETLACEATMMAQIVKNKE
jgi:UDP-3-O-[3-hydroxymyristoyl] N-acetylglucosamine deacetylase/3-hydroxyacyl-[acyl-carrier-protein] dehydratase